MKRATVYKRRKQFIVHASSRTTDGVWILGEPWLALNVDCDDVELQEAVLSALAGSRLDVPHPRAWGGILSPLLDLAGVKDWRTFSKGAACVEVEQSGSEIAVTPTVNLGPDEGYEADPSRRVAIGTSSAGIGISVRRLLIT